MSVVKQLPRSLINFAADRDRWFDILLGPEIEKGLQTLFEKNTSSRVRVVVGAWCVDFEFCDVRAYG